MTRLTAHPSLTSAAAEALLRGPDFDVMLDAVQLAMGQGAAVRMADGATTSRFGQIPGRAVQFLVDWSETGFRTDVLDLFAAARRYTLSAPFPLGAATTPQEIADLADEGLDPSYVRAATDLGILRLSTIVEAWRRGLPVEYLAASNG